MKGRNTYNRNKANSLRVKVLACPCNFNSLIISTIQFIMRKDEKVLIKLCLILVVITTVFTVLTAVVVSSMLLTFLTALMTVLFTLPIFAVISNK